MRYDEFINAVVDKGAAPDRQSAERITRATLETLGERIDGGEATDLASQLPPEMSGWVTSRTDAAESYDLDEFIRRIEQRADGAAGQPRQAAGTVMDVLSEAVTGGQIDHVRQQLPSDYMELFPA